MVVLGGINDITNENLPSTTDFAFVIDKSLEKREFPDDFDPSCGAF